MPSKKRYESQYGGGMITAAQYLGELACKHDALRKDQHLSNKFWNTNKWKRTYLSQVQAAYGILKLYDESIVVSVFSKNQNLYSIRSVKLDDLCDQEQKKKDNLATNAKPLEVLDKESPVRQQFRIKKSKLGKLK